MQSNAAERFTQGAGHTAIIASCCRLSNWALNRARIHTQLCFTEGKFILANGMIFSSSILKGRGSTCMDSCCFRKPLPGATI